MNFIDRIDNLMEQKGINKNQLAQMTGIPVSTIYGWYKKGYDNITLPTIRKLSSFFGCSMEYLANGENTERKSLSFEAQRIGRDFDNFSEEKKRLARGFWALLKQSDTVIDRLDAADEEDESVTG
jgi:transcriptional regulator with XRE-family HTH domain